MSAKTRINRPTYATPRKDQRIPRWLHISKGLITQMVNGQPVTLVSPLKGVTYRRPRG